LLSWGGNILVPLGVTAESEIPQKDVLPGHMHNSCNQLLLTISYTNRPSFLSQEFQNATLSSIMTIRPQLSLNVSILCLELNRSMVLLHAKYIWTNKKWIRPPGGISLNLDLRLFSAPFIRG
jgi:hypothetical protein